MKQEPLSMWSVAVTLFTQIATENPQLGLRGGTWSWTHFRRTFESELLASGACVKTTSRTWLAHRDKFPQVVAALLLKQPVPGISERTAIKAGD